MFNNYFLSSLEYELVFLFWWKEIKINDSANNTKDLIVGNIASLSYTTTVHHQQTEEWIFLSWIIYGDSHGNWREQEES